MRQVIYDQQNKVMEEIMWFYNFAESNEKIYISFCHIQHLNQIEIQKRFVEKGQRDIQLSNIRGEGDLSNEENQIKIEKNIDEANSIIYDLNKKQQGVDYAGCRRVVDVINRYKIRFGPNPAQRKLIKKGIHQREEYRSYNKFKIDYKDLRDGLHFNEVTEEKVFSLVVKSVEREKRIIRDILENKCIE